MKLFIRMRAMIMAGLAISAGLTGCQTYRDYMDRIPQPELPSLSSLKTVTPFRKSTTPAYAEPYRKPSDLTKPDLPVLPEPTTTNTPSRLHSQPVSRPPVLPPFDPELDPETPVPSAGLFPPGPVRKIDFETSSVVRDSNITPVGCFSSTMSSCCPSSCCPTACCVTSCCPTGCGMKSRIMGAVTRPYYSMKCRMQNAKARLRCKLSSFGSCCSPCCSPCAPICDPCSSCMSSGGYATGGVIVDQYPVNSGYSSYGTGYGNVATFPVHSQPVPQQAWRQPVLNFRRPPCPCQNQQPPVQYGQQAPYSPPQQYQAQPQYQGATRPVYPGPQTAVQPQPVQQPIVNGQNNSVKAAPSIPAYTAPQPVRPTPQVVQPLQQSVPQVVRPIQQPVRPTQPAVTPPSTAAGQATTLSPGHTPLASQPTRTAKIFRATRVQ